MLGGGDFPKTRAKFCNSRPFECPIFKFFLSASKKFWFDGGAGRPPRVHASPKKLSDFKPILKNAFSRLSFRFSHTKRQGVGVRAPLGSQS